MQVSCLIDELNGFESPDAIAAFLQSQGVKGYPAEAESCPISNWIRSCSDIEEIVTEEVIKVWYNEGDEEFQISDVVKSFITRVDNYDYPELLIDNVWW